MSTSTQWEQVLVYLNQLPFNLSDPLFNFDVCFFLFTLPIWATARSWLLFLLGVTLIGTALVSGLFWRGWRVGRPVLIHLAILGAILLALVAWQYKLDGYELVYSRRGSFTGAGYTDVRAQLPVYNILFVVTLDYGCAAAGDGIFASSVAVDGGRVGVVDCCGDSWQAMSIQVWYNVFRSAPNELNLERPYIENNIEFTRIAYDLNEIDLKRYEVSP